MNQPLVFLSCVSPEFRQTRRRVAAILTRLGYTPVVQEIFGTEPGDLRQVLRDKIDACHGLIQVGGYGYGALDFRLERRASFHYIHGIHEQAPPRQKASGQDTNGKKANSCQEDSP